ncbi:MAG TPA: transposase [Pyrinomonadaceae bacterium]
MLLTVIASRSCETIAVGDIIVLDNLTSHRASCIDEIVKECGGQILWLAPYSPDCSPIEKMWSKFLKESQSADAG